MKKMTQKIIDNAEETIVCDAGKSPLKNMAKLISDAELEMHGFYTCVINETKTLLITPELA